MDNIELVKLGDEIEQLEEQLHYMKLNFSIEVQLQEQAQRIRV